MIPKTLEDHIGIEIECIVKGSEYDLMKELARAKLSKIVEVGSDFSIKTGQAQYIKHAVERCRSVVLSYEGFSYEEKANAQQYIDKHAIVGVELRVLCKMSNLKSTLTSLSKVLTKVGAYVNNSCGLHVHLDMRMHSVATCAYRLLKKQELLRSRVDKRRLKSKYCRALTEKDLSNFLVNNYLSSRYKDINLLATREHRTIEVRLHEGTIDTNRILDWCNLLYRVAHTPTRHEHKKSLQSLLSA